MNPTTPVAPPETTPTATAIVTPPTATAASTIVTVPAAIGATSAVPVSVDSQPSVTPFVESCTTASDAHVVTAACTAPAVATVAVTTTVPPADKTLFELTAGAQFTRLHAAIKAAGLKDKLKSAGPYTLFAPTDAAFDKLPAGALDKLMKPENKERLISALNNHILGGRVLGCEIAQGREARMLGGKSTRLSLYGEHGEWVDTLGTNGVMHPIDRVVLPN